MAKMTDRELYELANDTFEEDIGLAAFNLVYEVRNGLLVHEGGDPPPEDLQLVAVMGVAEVADGAWVVQTVGDPPDGDEIVEAMKKCVLAFPEETEEQLEEMPEVQELYPTGIVAFAAWRLPDGGTRYDLYRNADIPLPRAMSLLKDVVAEAEAREAGAAPAGLGNN